MTVKVVPLRFVKVMVLPSIAVTFPPTWGPWMNTFNAVIDPGVVGTIRMKEPTLTSDADALTPAFRNTVFVLMAKVADAPEGS
jgi:hypothetical protein